MSVSYLLNVSNNLAEEQIGLRKGFSTDKTLQKFTDEIWCP
jgi:hypothetical protein